MKKERKEIKRIEYKDLFIADDGTEFYDENECKKYEETAKGAIRGMFSKIPQEVNKYFAESHDMFTTFCCDDNMYAVKVRNIDDVEVINKWILSHHPDNKTIGIETIGTIQLFDEYDSQSVWCIGTPDDLKKKYSDAIDSLFSTLIEKSEEGEKA